MALPTETTGVLMFGTYPAESITEAVSVIADEVGDYFDVSMPNGEVATDQIDWHKQKMANAKKQAGVHTIRDGDLSSLAKAPLYRLEDGLDTLPTDNGLNVTYYQNAKSAIGEFTEAAHAKGLDGLKMQQDWAGSMEDPALWFAGDTLFRGLRRGWKERELRNFFSSVKDGFFKGIAEFETAYHEPFKKVMQDHVKKIKSDPELQGTLLHQISAPVGHTLVHALYKLPVSQKLRDAAVEYVTDTLIDQIHTFPLDWLTGVHPCLTDLQNTAPIEPNPRKTWPMEASVAYINALIRKWPKNHPAPAYIGLPLTTNHKTASLKPGFYDPLKDLELPAETRFGLGYIHRGMSVDDHLRVYQYVDDRYPHAKLAGSACGLGRLREEILGEAGKDAAIDTLRMHKAVLDRINNA